MKDLSTMFDIHEYEHLIVKLYTFGISKEFPVILLSYLSNRWQRTKINTLLSP